MEKQHLETLYHILVNAPRKAFTDRLEDGSMDEDEIMEATNALAEEVGNAPILEPGDLED